MKIEVELQPFQVPNFVLTKPKVGLKQDGIQEVPKFALADLTPEALDELCTRFRRDVFAKASKYDPENDRPRSAP